MSIFQPFIYIFNLIHGYYDHYLILSHYNKKLISFHQPNDVSSFYLKNLTKTKWEDLNFHGLHIFHIKLG